MDLNHSFPYNDQVTTNVTTPGIPINPDLLSRVDVFLACICILCMCLGVPGNLLALIHFISEHRSLANPRKSKMRSKKMFFTDIYMVVAICDLLVCFSLPAQIESYFSGRDNPVLFSNHVFCNVWGALWEVLPYFSVFLVGCLSISRLLTLLYPLVNFNRTVTVVVFTGYMAQLILTRLIPILTDNGHFKYGPDVNYCFLRADNWMFLSIICAVQMALPILPIFLSCLITIFKLHNLKKLGAGSTKKHDDATVTVIIFTFIYLLYNLPIFINYIYFMRCWINEENTYLEQYGHPFMYWYSWNITFIICIAMNSTSNPILYFFRMSSFKAFVLRRQKEGRGFYRQLSGLLPKRASKKSRSLPSDVSPESLDPSKTTSQINSDNGV